MADSNVRKTKISIGLPTFVFFAVLFVADFSVMSIMPFLAALLHEMGHVLAMKTCGIKISDIKIYPFGVDIKKQQSLTSYATDIFISIAGILTNIAAMIACNFLPPSDNISFFVSSNVVLIIINVLPIRTLDGGMALEKLLLLKMRYDIVDGVMNFLSLCSILLLGSVAIWLLFYTSYNFSLLLMCMYLFCGIFLGKK